MKANSFVINNLVKKKENDRHVHSSIVTCTDMGKYCKVTLQIHILPILKYECFKTSVSA